MAANSNPSMPSPAPVAANPSTQAGSAATAQPSAEPKHTRPFPHYPHICHLAATDQYIELECPICGANARGDRPYDFLGGPQAFATHNDKMHQGGDVDFRGHQHKVLSGDEVAKIRAGEAQSIVKRKVFNKEKNHTEEKPSNALIEQYLCVIQDGNKYYKLACHVCGANSRKDRGSGNQIWINGLAGMRLHMTWFHEDLPGDQVTTSWLLKNCGTEISAQEFQQLQKDMTGGMIQKSPGDKDKQQPKSKGVPNAVVGGRKRKRDSAQKHLPLHLDQEQDQGRDISMQAGSPNMNVMPAFGAAASGHQQVHTGSSNGFLGQPSSASRARPNVGPGVYAPGSQRPLGPAAQMMININMPAAPSVDAHASGATMSLGMPRASRHPSMTGAAIRDPILKGPTNQAQGSPSPYPGRFTRPHTQPAMLPPPSGAQFQPRPPVSQGPIEEVDYVLDDEAPPGWRPAGVGGWRTYPDGENTVFREPLKPGDPLILPPMPKK